MDLRLEMRCLRSPCQSTPPYSMVRSLPQRSVAGCRWSISAPQVRGGVSRPCSPDWRASGVSFFPITWPQCAFTVFAFESFRRSGGTHRKRKVLACWNNRKKFSIHQEGSWVYKCAQAGGLTGNSGLKYVSLSETVGEDCARKHYAARSHLQLWRCHYES
jgi:hypothetical protein